MRNPPFRGRTSVTHVNAGAVCVLSPSRKEAVVEEPQP